jgi:hypothetical protein
MDRKTALEILEALAAGVSPATGEVTDFKTILEERNVIRALQFAIDYLTVEEPHLHEAVTGIENREIDVVMELIKDEGKTVTANNLTSFFLGNRTFKNEKLLRHPLYGKYQGKFTKGQLIDFFHVRLNALKAEVLRNQVNDGAEPFTFYEQEKFNRLSANAVNQLRDKVASLGIVKSEGLTENVISARKMHPRAYEPWSSEEIELLRKAIQYTNDLELLSSCFQRGKTSIEAATAKLFRSESVNA